MSDDRSPATTLIDRLVANLGRRVAHQVVDVALDKMSIVELAAFAHDWSNLWARPKQIAPACGGWASWGFLCGRGFGKTRSIAEHVNEEVEAGRSMLVGLAAQNEDKSVDVQVKGKSGLIATAPPWCKPEWRATDMELHWPNGAVAKVLTPEVPGNIRGPEFDLSWICEVQSWPVATREEAFSNFLLSTRLGYARLVWDATPKRGHPILLKLLARAKKNPTKHVVVRGTIRENRANLADGIIEELEDQMGGTMQGREELDGEMLEDVENVIAQQSWIDGARRPAPDRYARRGIGVDPAVTSRRSSDRTGIVEAAVGSDGQGYVIADDSGKHEAPKWAALVLERYVTGRCDIVVVETNKGGNLLTQNLRAGARDRRLEVIVLGDKERPSHQAGKVFIREIYSKGEKADRARPLSTAYERGRISHVRGVDLSSLEATLTGWEPTPGARSPDDLDALTHIMVELLELTDQPPDPKVGFDGIDAMSRSLKSGTVSPTNLAALLGRGRGGRI